MDEEREIEIQELEKSRNMDNLKLGDFDNDKPIGMDLQEEEETDFNA